MNQTDLCLQRLFRAAARAERPLPTEAPFSLETRVLAAWRAGVPDDHGACLLPLFRGAFVCACAIILIGAALALHSLNEAPSNELVIVDSAIQLTLMP